MYNKLAASG